MILKAMGPPGAGFFSLEPKPTFYFDFFTVLNKAFEANDEKLLSPELKPDEFQQPGAEAELISIGSLLLL